MLTVVDLGLDRSQGDLDFVANQAAVGLQNHNKLHCRYFIFFHLMGYGKVSSWHNLLQETETFGKKIIFVNS